jgi:hypothetical protein
MKTRNTNTFRATLTGLKGSAFGLSHVFDWAPTIEIYQARVSPELWRSRPNLQRQGHVWESSSAIELMRLITADFVGLTKPWTEWTSKGECIRHVSIAAAAEGGNRDVA